MAFTPAAHHCNHDSPAFAVEEWTRAPQPYPDDHPHRRGLSAHSAGGWNASALWEPLRINHTVTAMVNLTAAQESFLTEQLLPVAMAWVSSALRVVRSSAPLHARRTCFQEWYATLGVEPQANRQGPTKPGRVLLLHTRVGPPWTGRATACAGSSGRATAASRVTTTA
eukprot:scaffold74610_cov42-Phaeocystis_antarctica.AAC.2